MFRTAFFSLTLALTINANAGSALEEPAFSRQDSRPWVVMVTQPGCSFCSRLEHEILQTLRFRGVRGVGTIYRSRYRRSFSADRF